MSASKRTEKGPPTNESPTVEDRASFSGDDIHDGDVVNTTAGSQALHRKLHGKEVQLFAIGGAIGTCSSLSDS